MEPYPSDYPDGFIAYYMSQTGYDHLTSVIGMFWSVTVRIMNKDVFNRKSLIDLSASITVINVSNFHQLLDFDKFCC